MDRKEIERLRRPNCSQKIQGLAVTCLNIKQYDVIFIKRFR